MDPDWHAYLFHALEGAPYPYEGLFSWCHYFSLAVNGDTLLGKYWAWTRVRERLADGEPDGGP